MAHNTGCDFWVRTLRNSLDKQHYSCGAIKNYGNAAKRFLRYIEGRGVPIESVQPDCVAAYLRLELNRYRRKHGHHPDNMRYWRSYRLAAVHRLLTLAQRTWPPISAAEARVQWFAEELKGADYTRCTIKGYLQVAHNFLICLDGKGLNLHDVKPSHVSAFIDRELRLYQKRHRRLPTHVVRWRCGLTTPIHILLKKVCGAWPPPLLANPHINKLEEQLRREDFAPATVARYVFRARHFLAYLEARGIPIEQVTPAIVRAYRWKQLAAYRKKYGRQPLHECPWTAMVTSPVSHLLRVQFGVWPPGSEPDPIIEEFHRHLINQGFSPTFIPAHLTTIRCFLRHLKQWKRSLASVEPDDVSCYLKVRLARYRRHYGHLPRNLAGWRHVATGAVHRLLRMAYGHWPPTPLVTNEAEQSRNNLVSTYAVWMVDLHGLSRLTVRTNSDAARVFLGWLGETERIAEVSQITVATIDRFLAWRNPGLRRVTRQGVVSRLRSFLRFLYDKGHLDSDLARAVSGVRLYRFEDIPKAFSPSQIKALLDYLHKDRRPVGLRDYAIVILLARYGLRSGEVARLRLEYIDWKREQFHVIQSKSHLPLRLPLSVEAGNAILRYLRNGRPPSKAREIFLRSRAPQGPFTNASTVGSMIHKRLLEAGIQVEGRRGPHAFRHAHAANLLRAQVSLKTIGDLLGHRAPKSTTVYLKLATDDLRSVGLELPGGEQ